MFSLRCVGSRAGRQGKLLTAKDLVGGAFLQSWGAEDGSQVMRSTQTESGVWPIANGGLLKTRSGGRAYLRSRKRGEEPCCVQRYRRHTNMRQ